MAKKVAVIMREKQHEALRMSVGLTLEDAAVSVFVMDRKLPSSEEIDLNVETLGDMDAKIYSNNPENSFEQMSTEDIARALVDFDVVMTY